MKICMSLYAETTATLLLLGKDYETKIAELKIKKDRPKLDLLGTILPEKNHIDLLDMMAKLGEVTIRDIESELNMNGAGAYYHLSMMLRIGMVKTRNRGRTLLYSLSDDYFSSTANALLQYMKKN